MCNQHATMDRRPIRPLWQALAEWIAVNELRGDCTRGTLPMTHRLLNSLSAFDRQRSFDHYFEIVSRGHYAQAWID